MAKSGPIILIEDDEDDRDTMRIVLNQLEIKNELLIFDSPSAAISYLSTTSDRPFIILCDINMPEQTGLQFKKDIDANPQLRRKSIPFVFYSTATDAQAITEAYLEITVQGFFRKGDAMQDIKNTMKAILDYWMLCYHPNT